MDPIPGNLNQLFAPLIVGAMLSGATTSRSSVNTPKPYANHDIFLNWSESRPIISTISPDPTIYQTICFKRKFSPYCPVVWALYMAKQLLKKRRSNNNNNV